MLGDEGDAEVLARRIRSVTAVQQVVHAIWALARAQLPLARQAVRETSSYLDAVDAVAARLVGEPAPRGATEALWIVVGPERAFCGTLAQRLLEQLPPTGTLGLVGRRLIEMAAGDGALGSRVVFCLPGAASHDEPEGLAPAVAEAVLTHAAARQVELLSPRAGGKQLVRSVLLAGERLPVAHPPQTYSPYTTVVEAALREALTGRIAVGLAEALHSEVRARVAAAERARNATRDQLQELTSAWRAARQREITSEIQEAVAGRQVALRAADTPSGAAPGPTRAR